MLVNPVAHAYGDDCRGDIRRDHRQIKTHREQREERKVQKRGSNTHQEVTVEGTRFKKTLPRLLKDVHRCAVAFQFGSTEE